MWSEKGNPIQLVAAVRFSRHHLCHRISGTGASMSARHCIVGAIFALSVSAPLLAQTTDVEFFEAKIRPVLVQRCYSCHNSKMAAPKGDLVLDTKEGLLKGGASGPALVPGKPAESRLLKALSYTDPLAQMPPSGKLPTPFWPTSRNGLPRAPSILARAHRRSRPRRLNTKACRSRTAASGGRSSRSPRMRRRRLRRRRAGPPTRSTTSSWRSSPRRSSSSLRRPTSARW